MRLHLSSLAFWQEVCTFDFDTSIFVSLWLTWLAVEAQQLECSLSRAVGYYFKKDNTSRIQHVCWVGSGMGKCHTQVSHPNASKVPFSPIARFVRRLTDLIILGQLRHVYNSLKNTLKAITASNLPNVMPHMHAARWTALKAAQELYRRMDILISSNGYNWPWQSSWKTTRWFL